MITRYQHHNVEWLDVFNPTTKEIRSLFDECDLPGDFMNDLTGPTPQTHALLRPKALKITLDFPIVKRTDINHPHEVKFIATKKHLVTIRFEEIEAMHRYTKEFEVASVLTNAGKKMTGAHVFFSLLTYLYDGLNLKLDHLESRMREVEENIFNDNEKEMLFEISGISQRIIAFRQTLVAHEHALSELRSGIGDSFGTEYHSQIVHLEVIYRHLLSRATTLASTLDDLRDTNNALLTTKQNEIMKILTIMAFITFPLTLFTSLFGMNTTTTPLVGAENDFYLILSIMIALSIGFFGYFKYKKWM